MHTETLIAGAGLGGLSLAHALQRKGTACLLVEARDRVGGRILTLESTHAGIGTALADIGPSWIWPGQARVESLLQQFDIDTFEQYSSGRLVFQDESGQVRRDLEFSTMAGSLRIAGGLARLTRTLASRLPPDCLQLSHRVTRIERRDQEYQVTLEHAHGSSQVLARNVVLAIPPRVVVQHIEFEPALPAGVVDDLQSIPTWMAGQAKLFALYPKPFWRAAGLSGDAISHLGPLVEIHDASPADAEYGALFGFVGVPVGAPLRVPASLTAAARTQLETLFGPAAANPLDILLKDWAEDDCTATAADGNSSAHPQYRMPASLAGLADQGLIFASSEMAPQFGGFIEGALEAAENASLRLS